MSSPAMESASTSSSTPARLRSSNRGTSWSESGSISANSSSRPTVKSVAPSKVSRAATRSINSREVEVERVQQVHGRARRVDRDLRRHLQQRLGVVEDDLDAGVDELVGELLRRP